MTKRDEIREEIGQIIDNNSVEANGPDRTFDDHARLGMIDELEALLPAWHKVESGLPKGKGEMIYLLGITTFEGAHRYDLYVSDGDDCALYIKSKNASVDDTDQIVKWRELED